MLRCKTLFLKIWPKGRIFKIHNPEKAVQVFFYEHIEFEGKKLVKLSSATDAAYKNLVSSIVWITMLANMMLASTFFSRLFKLNIKKIENFQNHFKYVKKNKKLLHKNIWKSSNIWKIYLHINVCNINFLKYGFKMI